MAGRRGKAQPKAARKKSRSGLKWGVLIVLLGLVGFGSFWLLGEGSGAQALPSFSLDLAAADNGAVQIKATPKPTLAPVKVQTPTPSPTPTPPPPTPQPTPAKETITVRVVGDLMVHDRQLASALQEDGSYNFVPEFASITNAISKADVAIGNLEVCFFGEEKAYTGFPKFNTPDAFADAIFQAGFDVVTTANNHAFDFRLPGVQRTLEVAKNAGLTVLGTAGSEEEAQQHTLLMDVRGVKLGILAYTDTFNHKPEQPYAVFALSRDTVRRDVATLQEQGADFIVAMVHWGEEYMEFEGSSQRHDAEMLVAEGVDAVMGSHPHVLQPAQMLTVQDDSGVEHTGFVTYSMGNFLSNMQDRPRDRGIIWEFVIEKDFSTGEATLTAIHYVPTMVYRWHEDGKDQYDILPVGLTMLEEEMPYAHHSKSVWRKILELYGEEYATPIVE